MEQAKMQLTQLDQQLEHCQRAVKSVYAQYDAVVVSLGQRNTGNVVAAGTVLCKLNPRVGMRGEARITVGRRTLLEIIFEPLRRLRENIVAR